MEIRRGTEVNVSPFAIDPIMVTGRRIPVRARLGGTANGYVVPFVTARLEPGLRAGAGQPAVRGRCPSRPAAQAGRPLGAVAVEQAVGNNAALKALAYKAFRRLPVKRGLAVFESHMGKQYSDSPRYIYEAAVAAGLDRLGLDPVWSYARRTDGFPTDVRLVRRGQLALPPGPRPGASSGWTTRASRGPSRGVARRRTCRPGTGRR